MKEENEENIIRSKKYKIDQLKLHHLLFNSTQSQVLQF